MIAPNPYAALVGPADPLTLLSTTPDRIEETVRGWDAARWARSYAPGKWSGAQLVLHLAQDEIGWGARVRMALSVDGYTVQPYDGARWVERESPADPEAALAAFRALRRLNLVLWNRLSNADRERPFSHPETGEISIGWILEVLAGHDLHHLKHLEAIGSGPEKTLEETARFEGCVPILRVKDLGASVDHYVRVLGFKLDWGGGGGMASVSRGRASIMLCQGAQGCAGTWVWIGVADAAAVFREYTAAGARITGPPRNYPWAYELHVEDPDGHVLRFGSDPKGDRPFDEWAD